jgi:hypothetical protein
MSIRKQLKKYLERFGIPAVSCEGDAVRLRKCLVSGYFKVGWETFATWSQVAKGAVERGKDDARRDVQVRSRGRCESTCSS